MKEQFQVDMIDKIIVKTNKQTKRNNDVFVCVAIYQCFEQTSLSLKHCSEQRKQLIIKV